VEITITRTFEDLGITYTEGEHHHVATSVAERFFQAKAAVRRKYAWDPKRQNANYWLEDMAERERLRVAALPQDQRQIFHSTPVWRLVYNKTQNRFGVELLRGSETFLYGEAIAEGGYSKATEKQFVAVLTKDGCPKEIIEQWRQKRVA
jgi:hypothetical protein